MSLDLVVPFNAFSRTLREVKTVRDGHRLTFTIVTINLDFYVGMLVKHCPLIKKHISLNCKVVYLMDK